MTARQYRIPQRCRIAIIAELFVLIYNSVCRIASLRYWLLERWRFFTSRKQGLCPFYDRSGSKHKFVAIQSAHWSRGVCGHPITCQWIAWNPWIACLERADFFSILCSVSCTRCLWPAVLDTVVKSKFQTFSAVLTSGWEPGLAPQLPSDNKTCSAAKLIGPLSGKLARVGRLWLKR